MKCMSKNHRRLPRKTRGDQLDYMGLPVIGWSRSSSVPISGAPSHFCVGFGSAMSTSICGSMESLRVFTAPAAIVGVEAAPSWPVPGCFTSAIAYRWCARLRFPPWLLRDIGGPKLHSCLDRIKIGRCLSPAREPKGSTATLFRPQRIVA